MIQFDRSRFKNIIKRLLNSKIPGLYESLEPLCMSKYKKECLDLFLDEPERFREILILRFKDQNFIYLLIRYSIIKPLLGELGKLDLEEKLTNVFINNTNQFKQIIENIIAA